jgi:hypothetical protein
VDTVGVICDIEETMVRAASDRNTGQTSFELSEASSGTDGREAE